MSQVNIDEAAIQAAVVQQLVERYSHDPSLRRDVVERLAGYGQPLQLVEKEVASRLKANGIDHVTTPARVQEVLETLVRRRVEAYLTPEQLGTLVGTAVSRLLADAYGKRIKAAAKRMVEAAMTAMVNDTE